MPSLADHRTAIAAQLKGFQSRPLSQAARSLLAGLGYKSDRTIQLPNSSPRAFLEFIRANGTEIPFSEEKALCSEWKSADLLFQLTDDELSGHQSLFKETAVNPGLLRSYLFFAIELTGDNYARGKLTGIARQINRVFPMPVMVLIKHLADKKPVLSIAVINRRQNKRDAAKDVLGKVTIIRDISLAEPHRGHLDILDSFAVPNLVHPQRLPINNFDTLHAAWEEIFNVELLNKRFYRELANWYFWALPQVEFPADIEKDDEKRRATGLIRLLTRLIFCWFLKEKGLIPEKLFVEAELKKILNDLSPDASTYNEAILQNLFFATLNQRMGSDRNGQPFRAFARDEGFQKNRATYGVDTLYRYEEHFREPATALDHFADVPFLNGGLFECLDRTEEGTDRKLYLDGFSRNKKKRPTIPNRLFFGSEREEDLSEAYGDTKRKKEKVRGLLRILHSYKFTIVENTPIDQEIALDPELLGKVFENLLASYNEETKTTARKQTGSFYTPRPIVEYMVVESLKAHLTQKVEQTILSAAPLKSFNKDAATHKTRRNLPHWTQDGRTYWITFRLADSLPAVKLKAWQEEKTIWLSHHPEPWSEEQWKEYDERFGRRLDEWLDAGEGECYLRRPEIRAIVEKCLLHFAGQRYDLPAWVIMPNHVHLLITPGEGQALSKIMQGIKGVSAKECNALLHRTGETFWQDESFDHIVRSQAQFDHFVRYIVENPVKARLNEGEFSVAQTILSGPSESKSEKEQTGLSAPLSSRLDQLFSYTEAPHQFSELEVAALLDAIHTCKILDPACGSGAFPMGMLQKLVYIIHKLDPDNARWKQLQIDTAAKIPNPSARDAAITAIERDFADNEDDYGRKLYLIENCLYGVDIQPIAIQISKLRFFISLVCDQRTNRSKKENHGIRPLPNLETKFVAANTLIGLPEMDHSLLVNPRVRKIETEIETLYHSHFSIQRRDQKLALQRTIKDLRKELGRLLTESLMAPKKAQHVADWNPFDPQASSDFFDPQWMFGRSLADGFDVVIGNPPYRMLQPHNTSQAELDHLREHYVSADFKIEMFHLFLQRGTSLLTNSGCLGYILPTTLLNNVYAEKLRRWLMLHCAIRIIAVSPDHVFAEADVHTSVVVLTRETEPKNRDRNLVKTTTELTPDFAQHPSGYAQTLQSRFAALPGGIWNVLLNESNAGLIDKLRKAGPPLEAVSKINRGLITGNRKKYFSDVKLTQKHVPILAGGDVERYFTKAPSEFVLFERPDSAGGCWDKSVHLAPHKIVVRQIGTKPTASLLGKPIAVTGNIFTIRGKSELHEKLLLGIVNSKLVEFFWRIMFSDFKSTFPQVTIFSLAQVPVALAARDDAGGNAECDAIAILVDRILATKRTDADADTNALEREIDQHVYALYGLTSEEIKIVEDAAK